MAALSIMAKGTQAAYSANRNADRASCGNANAMNTMIAASTARITNNAASGRCNRKKIGDQIKFNPSAIV